MAGLTTAGLVTNTQDEIVASIRAAIAASPALGANLNTAPESALGQLAEIVAGALRQGHEVAEALYSAWSPLTATGAALDQLVRIRGVSPRLAATSSRVTLGLTGTPGTVIPAGSAVTLSETSTRWTLDPVLGDVTIPAGGTAVADFLADTTGPLSALAGSTWTIATPVTGWASVLNAADATLGRDRETDGELRARALQAINAGPGSAPDSIRTALLGLAGVTEAIVIENRSILPDLDGRPGKSFEIVIRGGTDQAIADQIWHSKSVGSETATTVAAANQVSASVNDSAGNPQTIRFSRPDLIPVWVEVDYTPRSSAPTDVAARIQQAILDFDAAVEIGQDVTPTDVEQAILCYPGLGGVFSSLTLRMGLSASPPIAQQVPAALTQLPDFDSGRITITRV